MRFVDNRTTDAVNKGAEFMLEAALNGDMEATSFSYRVLNDDGVTEDKYYLRHDESKVCYTQCMLPSDLYPTQMFEF